VTITPPPIRSLDQNRLYWSAIVQPFAEFLQEHDPNITKLDAHELLKRRFLAEPILDHLSGEVLVEAGRIRSTTSLSTAQFGEYIDRCARHLRECFNITINLPEERNDL
jgi:hypothetical protein